jgi:hypothetical protein
MKRDVAEDTTRLVELLHGRLPLLSSLRLRLRIRWDSELAAEYKALDHLKINLGNAVNNEIVSPEPRWPTIPTRTNLTIRIGGLTMKRQTIYAFGAVFLTITGAIAAQQWIRQEPEFAVSDTSGLVWHIRSDFRGTVRIYDPKGKIVGATENLETGSASGRVSLRVQGNSFTVAGLGRHEIRTRSGEMLGSIELAVLSTEEANQMRRDSDQVLKRLVALYTRSEVFTTDGETAGTAGTRTMVGLVTGYSRTSGLSWKTRGYANVKTDYILENHTHQVGGSGAWIPIETVPPEVRSTLRSLQRFAPKPGSLPITHWQQAAPVAKTEQGYDITSEGTWRKVLRSGTFTGYGTFEAKDDTGKVILQLDVMPLTGNRTGR